MDYNEIDNAQTGESRAFKKNKETKTVVEFNCQTTKFDFIYYKRLATRTGDGRRVYAIKNVATSSARSCDIGEEIQSSNHCAMRVVTVL